jgi:flavin reductase (DIM6/NTAB) family NADH-FMN oxidoreductase RutF
MDTTRFRRLLGAFATGVAVATARDAAGNPAGMTASAIASVSLEPPLLLVCVWEEADFHATIASAAHFGLNILAEDQEALSRRFAIDHQDRFAGCAWHAHATGVPILDGTAGSIICARDADYRAGDHTIFLGRVLDGAVSGRSPLLHVHGAYRRLR